MSKKACRALGCVLIVAGGSAATGQQASFRGLSFVPGTEPASAGLGMSANGAYVAGWCDLDAVRWSSTEVQTLGRLASPFGGIAVAYAISGDGSVVVGFGRGEQVGTPFWAFAWDEQRGMIPLCPPPDENSVFGSYASGVSADGRVIVGASDSQAGYLRAFMTTPDRQWDALTTDPSSASAVSGDGLSVVGVVNQEGTDRAFIWSEAAGVRTLPDLPGGSESAIAYGVNENGTIIVGGSASASSDPDYAYEAVRWTNAGEMRALGDLPGGDYSSEARGVSNDGSVIVGLSSVSPSPRTAAFIWDEEHGMRDLRTVLIEDHHLDLTGWELSTAQAISSDGRTIVGRGVNPEGQLQAWVAQLGGPCAADWNADGEVTMNDFIEFIDAFLCVPDDEGHGCPSADFDQDGNIDTRDFFAFVIAYFNGCV